MSLLSFSFLLLLWFGLSLFLLFFWFSLALRLSLNFSFLLCFLSCLDFRDYSFSFRIYFKHLFFWLKAFSDLVNGSVDHINKAFKWILIERVDFGEIWEQKVNQSTSWCSRTIELWCFIDLGLSNFGDLHLLSDFNWNFLRILQILNECNVIQDITFGICKFKQQLIFQFL